MIEGLFGNASAEKVLLYLEQYGEGYAFGISKTFGDMSVGMCQQQLKRFEAAGLLVSELQGRTRIYRWNARYPFTPEVRALLKKAINLLPKEERLKYFAERRRPRRTGKPD